MRCNENVQTCEETPLLQRPNGSFHLAGRRLFRLLDLDLADPLLVSDFACVRLWRLCEFCSRRPHSSGELKGHTMVSLSRLLWGRWAADGLCCSVPGHVPAASMPLPATHNGCGRIGRAPPHPQSESDRQSGSVALAACSAAESGQQSVDPRARRRAIGSARDARGASGGRERAADLPTVLDL